MVLSFKSDAVASASMDTRTSFSKVRIPTIGRLVTHSA
jgi:hypothetical protein